MTVAAVMDDVAVIFEVNTGIVGAIEDMCRGRLTSGTVPATVGAAVDIGEGDVVVVVANRRIDAKVDLGASFNAILP